MLNLNCKFNRNPGVLAAFLTRDRILSALQTLLKGCLLAYVVHVFEHLPFIVVVDRYMQHTLRFTLFPLKDES